MTIKEFRRLCVAFVFVSAGAAVPAGCGGKAESGRTCDFKLKWPPGRKCAYVVTVNEETVTKKGPGVIPKSRAAGPGAGRGNADLKMAEERVDQTIEASLSDSGRNDDTPRVAELVIVSALVDRWHKEGKEPAMRAKGRMAGITGARVQYTIDPDGRPLHVDGVYDFMKQAIGESPLANETFAKVFNEDFLKQMRITGWKFLPEGPAEPGYAWYRTDRIEITGVGMILVRVRHRFDKWLVSGGRPCARIVWWGRVGKVVGRDSAEDVFPETLKKVETSGSCLFSPTLGTIVEWSEDIKTTVALDIPGQPGIVADVRQDMRRRTSVALSRTDDAESGGGLFAGKKLKVVTAAEKKAAGRKPKNNWGLR